MKKGIIIGGGIVSLSLIMGFSFSLNKGKNEIMELDKVTTKNNLEMLAIKQENDSGEYESTETIPTSGYTLSSDSYCNVDGTKDESIKITYENGKVSVSEITKKTKCYLYFNKSKAIDKIIGDTSGIQEKTEFTGIATSADTGIYSAPDDYGTSYYFRGLEGSLNNWVKFADSYWRIIRVNGNGTVRMIYAGSASGAVSNANRTGTTTQINGTTYTYNPTYNDNTYVGYMKSLNNSGNTSSYSQAHSNLYDSNAKATIDSWYKTNIEDKELSKYIDVNTGFCNDRQIDKTAHSSYQGDGYGTQQSGYAPWGRVYQNGSWKTTQTPTLQCTNKERDLFTVNNTNTENKGNKKLQYPVGMITSDEVVFAGGFGGTANSTYYLYTNQNYWTMSPRIYHGSYADVFIVDSNGGLDGSYVRGAIGLRPTINLRADTAFTGDGSETSPFEVV